jgi:surface protein
MNSLTRQIFRKTSTVVPFISTWNTANVSNGSSTLNQIKLPIAYGGTYNFVVYWGDGSSSTITSYNQSEVLHNYAVSGIYEIKITGICKGWVFYNQGDKDKIISISQWGCLNLIGGGIFYGCSNLDLSTVSDLLDLTGINSLDTFFMNCSKLKTVARINEWDISNIKQMAGMFLRCLEFNQSIVFDAPKLNSVNQMFFGCTKFNSPVTLVSDKLTSYKEMFYDCSSFNSPLNIPTKNITAIDGMFGYCSVFNQDISNWDTSNVTNMKFTFGNCSAFNQNIGNWNTSKVTTMENMFRIATVFNQDISNWDTSLVTNMQDMFQLAKAFNQDIGKWDISQVAYSFSGAKINYPFIETLSVQNYDSLLTKWSLQSVKPNLKIIFKSKYTASGLAGRNILKSAPNNWIVDDYGMQL